MSTTETPGKVWICPACGNRYDAPTTCSNDHAPVEAQEYDLAPEDATTETTGDTAAADTTTETTDTTAAATVEAPVSTPLDDAKVALEAAKASLESALSNLDQHIQSVS